MKVRQLSDSQGLSYLHLVMLSLYAILLGVLVGLIDAVFGRVLIGLSEFRDHHLFYLVPALPGWSFDSLPLPKVWGEGGTRNGLDFQGWT